MTELTPEAQNLVDAARGGDDPSPAARARVRAALLAQIGAAPRPTSPRAGHTGLIVGVATVATIGIVVGAWLMLRDRNPAPPPAPSIAAPAPAPVITSLPPEPAPSPSPPPPPSPSPSPSPPPPPPPSPSPSPSPPRRPSPPPASASAPTADSIRAERALLAAANAALRDGDPAAALATLATHASRFPHGVLVEERNATRVLALCAAGRTADAEAARTDFLARWPRSVHAARVRTACVDPPP